MTLEISTKTQTTLAPTKIYLTENIELSTLPVRHVAKRTTPQRDVTLEPMQQCSKQATFLEEPTSRTGYTRQNNWLCPGYSPTFQLERPLFHSRTLADRPETSRRICQQSHVLSGSKLWKCLWIVQVS